MRLKFIILALAMMAYGWYLHSFAVQAQAGERNLQQAYARAVNDYSY